MFENTLLIVKSDFMVQRKCLLLHLLSKRFQIQGSRKLSFRPEDAAEFYKDFADDKCYMLYVILLSKGTSEAFILRKCDAVQQLNDVLVMFFGTSMEMDRNVHVSRSISAARREISFIFPNYIHEPIDYFDQHKFMKQSIVGQVVCEAYNIIKKPSEQEDWRSQLSTWLLRTNPVFPQITNQCSQCPNIAFQEKSQQTAVTTIMEAKDAAEQGSLGSLSTVLGASSDLLTTSSCLTCSSFRSDEPMDAKAKLAEFERRLKMRSTKTMAETKDLVEIPPLICDVFDEHVYDDGEGSVSGEDSPEHIEQTIADANQLQAMAQSLAQTEKEPEVQSIQQVEDRPPAEGEAVKAEETINKEESTPAAEEGENVIESAAEPDPISAQAAADAEAQPEADAVVEGEPEQAPATETIPEPETQPEAQSEAQPEAQPVENVIEPAAEAAPQEAEPETQPEAQPEPEPEAQPEPEAEPEAPKEE